MDEAYSIKRTGGNTSKSKVALQYGEGEVDKVELGRGKLSHFVTKFSSKIYLFRARGQSSKKCKEETHMEL